MSTNMTLSLTVRDEAQAKLAGNILSDAFDRLIDAVPDLLSVNLSVFDDDFTADAEAQEPADDLALERASADGEVTSADAAV